MLFMRARGWRIDAMASPGKYEATLRSHSIPFHPASMHPRISPLHDLLSIGQILKGLKRIRPTIIHAHTLKAGLLGMVSASVLGVPVQVFHVHGLPHLGARGIKRLIVYWATRVTCMLSDRVLCVSVSIRDVLIAQRLCPEDKAVVPVNGSCDGIDAVRQFNPDLIDPGDSAAVREKFNIPGQAPVVAFIARLVRHKGLVELCEAWRILRAQHPDLHLLIAGGSEPSDPAPPEIIEAFKMDPRAHMAGFCDNMPQLYTAVDLVVLPSYYEGFPTVLLEAAAMGVPVVATSIPGNLDAVIDNVTGTLVPPHDSPALASAVNTYIDDQTLRRTHGNNARQRVLTAFRPEPLREFISYEYDQLLKMRGIDPPPPLSAETTAVITIETPALKDAFRC